MSAQDVNGAADSRSGENREAQDAPSHSLRQMVGWLYGAVFIGSLCWFTAIPSLVGLLVWVSVLSVGVAAWMRETRKNLKGQPHAE